MINNRSRALDLYPDCAAFYSGENPDQFVVVGADMRGGITTAASAGGLTFGAALWLAMALHAIGVEVYVSRSA